MNTHESPEMKTALRINTACLLAVALILVLLLTGCAPCYIMRQVPTTDAERAAVAEQVRMIMLTTPRTLSGHDQDWDDAIAAATRSANETLCRPTLWEWDRGGARWTGRWHYVDEPEPVAKPTRGKPL